MVNRYFIWLSYDGSRYRGWQIQPNAISVQEEIQKALGLLFRKPMEIVGAGRTDAGVHAQTMVAHFDTDVVFVNTQLAYKLNRLLPKDIAINKIEAVASDMHARFSAKWRTYHYYVHQCKMPFCNMYSCELHYELDFDLMNVAASHLLEVDDFSAFCKSHTDVKTTLCHVQVAKWEKMGDGRMVFIIKANRFLRNMVRAVVGTLIEVGRHRLTIEDFDRVVYSGKRTEAGESMPGRALFLQNIEY